MVSGKEAVTDGVPSDTVTPGGRPAGCPTVRWRVSRGAGGPGLCRDLGHGRGSGGGLLRRDARADPCPGPGSDPLGHHDRAGESRPSS